MLQSFFFIIITALTRYTHPTPPLEYSKHCFGGRRDVREFYRPHCRMSDRNRYYR